MNSRLCSKLRYTRVICLLALHGAFADSSTLAICYSTPRAAIDAVVASSPVSSVLENGGYRVTKIQSDPVLGQRWAVVASCEHPEWPEFALPTNGASSFVTTARSAAKRANTAPMIRAGDIIQLWKQEDLLRIEVAGISEENGDLGKSIRVRLLRGSADDQSIPERFSGIVRGPSNVEIRP
jgi:hypothetical protein